MDADTLARAFASEKAHLEPWSDGHYRRLADEVDGVPRGTALFPGLPFVPGYPQIGRILRLETGLPQQVGEAFWAEEKVDGYNVRIFRLGDQVLALTRGGFVCPFTSDRLPDLLDPRVFDEQPGLVLCAEVAGPDQPYVVGHPPHVTEDVGLFVFDAMRLGRAGFLPYAEKTELLDRYALPSVQRYGRYSAARWRDVRELLWRLNTEGREGLVFKEDAPADRRTKYVTSNSCVDDIRVTVDNMLQLPAEYFTNRILRLALFMDEQGAGRAGDIAEQLGHALVDGLFQALETFKREGRVYHTHRCRFHSEDNARRMLRHLKRAQGHVHVAERRLEREGDYWVLEFDKLYLRMTDLLAHLRSGGLVFD